MKLMSFEAPQGPSFGIAAESGVVDLGPRLEGARGVADLLDPEAAARAARAARGAEADYRFDEIAWRRPIDRPGKFLCIGVNYAHRNEEYDDDAIPAYPSVFMRTPDSLVGHGAALVRPPESVQLDYEGEIAVVIGAGGRRIPRERAQDHIAALTCVNEGCVRDWMRHGKFNVTQGKNFDRCGAVGPWLVTADEFPDGYGDLRVRCRVNGETRQDDSTANLIFDFVWLVAYVSTWTTLERGDVISTGTPTGAGARFDPPRWLAPGDVVEVEVSGVGTLSNPVVDEG